MRRLGSRLAATLAAALVAGALALPATVAANTGEPIAQTGGMTATLPLLGVPGGLTVAVTLDKTTGKISGVVLTPTGDFTAGTTEPDFVKFANAAGTTTVSVKAKGDKLSIRAKAATLADFVGSGTWSADVFGTGSASSVPYTIGNDGSGHPTLAIGAVTAGSGITATVIPPTTHTFGHGASAMGGVTFQRDGFAKRLSISVKVDKDGHASLKITLSGKDRQKVSGTLVALAAAGSRTWSAHLCDGTPVSVTYHVAADGTIVFDSSVPATTTVKTGKFGTWVRFDGTKVGVMVGLRPNDDGTYTLFVKGSSGRCGGDMHDGKWFGDKSFGDKSKGAGHSGDKGFGGFGGFGSKGFGGFGH